MTTVKFKIGDEVTFSNAYGVNVITEIKGKTATTKEKNTGFEYKKRLSSLKHYEFVDAYIDEQEMAHLKFAKHNHGDVVFTTLSGDGNGVKMLWDDIKKECVVPSELTKI